MVTAQRQYKKILLSEVVSYERNNKKHWKNVARIADSIKRNEYIAPIIIDENNIILAWHGRKLALEQLGTTEVEVLQVSWLTEKQKADFRIADNRTTELSEWDYEAVLAEIGEFELEDLKLDFPDLDFDAVDLNKDAEDEVPDMDNVEIIVQKGDLFQLWDHRLMCWDATSIEDIELLMDGKKVDEVVTDPPYNLDYTGKTKDALKIENDKKTDNDFRKFLYDAFSCMNMFMKGGAVFYVRHADSEWYSFRWALEDAGLKVRQCLIWEKDVMVMGRQDYHWKHEPCLYWWKEGAWHLRNADRKQTTILRFDRPTRNKEHPTMKPVNLMEYLVSNNTKSEDLVLDPFLGGGSTLIACEKTNRICYWTELDPKYIQVILKRYYDYTKWQREIKCLNRDLDLTPILKND